MVYSLVSTRLYRSYLVEYKVPYDEMVYSLVSTPLCYIL